MCVVVIIRTQDESHMTPMQTIALAFRPPQAPQAPQASGARMYAMVDLFAGCGGRSLGFENAGFTSVFVNELNEDAIRTYLKNRHYSLGGMDFAENPDLHCNDAHELQGKRLDQLQADLASLPELGFAIDRTASKKVGGGSNLDVVTGGPAHNHRRQASNVRQRPVLSVNRMSICLLP